MHFRSILKKSVNPSFLKTEFFLFIALNAIGLWADSMQTTRWITDLENRKIKIPHPIQRVAANGALAQMVIMLGGGNKLVATGIHLQSNPMLLKIYPQIQDVPAIFGPPGGKSEVQLELLVQTHPEVMFGQQDAVSNLGIPSLAVSLLHFEDIKKTILLVGEVLGDSSKQKALEFCHYYDSTIQKISQQTSKAQRPKVYYASGEDGLSTEGKNTIASSWIRAAGGTNIAEEKGLTGSKKVSLEQIIQWNPDIIITNSANAHQIIMRSPQWKDIHAVKKHLVYQSPRGVYLWSVRSGEGVLQVPWAAQKIHPELFQDLDLTESVRDFYQRFYGYSLSPQDVQAILNPR